MTTSAWPSSVPMADAHVLRKMRRRQGSVWLTSRYPEISSEDREGALSVCMTDTDAPVAVIQSTPHLRNEFAAAAFLLGASLTQLGIVLQVARGTVHQAIKRRLTEEDMTKRRSYRLRVEAVQVMWNAFQAVVRSTPTAFDGMTITQLADFLEASVDMQEDVT